MSPTSQSSQHQCYLAHICFSSCILPIVEFQTNSWNRWLAGARARGQNFHGRSKNKATSNLGVTVVWCLLCLPSRIVAYASLHPTNRPHRLTTQFHWGWVFLGWLTGRSPRESRKQPQTCLGVTVWCLLCLPTRIVAYASLHPTNRPHRLTTQFHWGWVFLGWLTEVPGWGSSKKASSNLGFTAWCMLCFLPSTRITAYASLHHCIWLTNHTGHQATLSFIQVAWLASNRNPPPTYLLLVSNADKKQQCSPFVSSSLKQEEWRKSITGSLARAVMKSRSVILRTAMILMMGLQQQLVHSSKARTKVLLEQPHASRQEWWLIATRSKSKKQLFVQNCSMKCY